MLFSFINLKAKSYLGDVGEERKDDGEVEVVGRGDHVDLVWRARASWRGGPRGVRRFVHGNQQLWLDCIHDSSRQLMLATCRFYLDEVDMLLDWMDLVGVSGGACRFTPWPAGTRTDDSYL